MAKAFNEALLILCMKYVHTKLLSSSHGMRNDTNKQKNALKCMNLMFLLSGMNALPSQFHFRKTYYVVDHKKYRFLSDLTISLARFLLTVAIISKLTVSFFLLRYYIKNQIFAIISSAILESLL